MKYCFIPQHNRQPGGETCPNEIQKEHSKFLENRVKLSRHWKWGLYHKQTSHQNVARQVGMNLEEETESRVWAVGSQWKIYENSGPGQSSSQNWTCHEDMQFLGNTLNEWQGNPFKAGTVPQDIHQHHEELRRRSPDVSIVCKNHTSEPFCNIG